MELYIPYFKTTLNFTVVEGKYIHTLLMICLLSVPGTFQVNGSGGMSQAFRVFEHLLLPQRGEKESTNSHHCVEICSEGMHMNCFWCAM